MSATDVRVDPGAVLRQHRLYRTDATRWRVDLCPHCLEAWRGDPETGGCPTALLAIRTTRLEALLREVMESLSFCPICDSDVGHTPDCRLAAVQGVSR